VMTYTAPNPPAHNGSGLLRTKLSFSA
jgi:hypothetical protein